MEENIAGVTQTDAGSEKSLPCEREGDRVSGGGIDNPPVASRQPPLHKGALADEEFESLIKGKYKQAYDERVRETVRKRLKNAGKATETLNALAEKYGITVEDIDALARKGDQSNCHSERSEESASLGLKSPTANGPGGRMTEDKPAALEEIAQVRRLYPGMDVRRELENPRLRQLLQRGIDLRTAYEVVHRDEIIPAAMVAAARAVEKKLTGSAAVSRVAESAMESSCAALVKTDVAAMTRQQRADIIRRAEKGEKICF